MKTLLSVLAMLILTLPLHSQDLFLKQKGSKYIYVNASGERVIKKAYKEAQSFAEGLAAVGKNGLWGYIDATGVMVIPPQFKDANAFCQGLAHVKKDGAYYLIDQNGIVQSERYKVIEKLHTFYIFEKGGLWGIMNSNGKIIQQPILEAVAAYYQDMLTIKKDGQWGNWKDGRFIFDEVDLYFTKPEDLPLYSKTCLGIVDKEQRYICSNTKLIESFLNNMSYPFQAMVNKIQGTVVIEFVIDTEGNLINPKIKRDIGGTCGEAALEMVKKLGNWGRPGMQDGVPVNTIMYVPVKFTPK